MLLQFEKYTLLTNCLYLLESNSQFVCEDNDCGLSDTNDF